MPGGCDAEEEDDPENVDAANWLGRGGVSCAGWVVRWFVHSAVCGGVMVTEELCALREELIVCPPRPLPRMPKALNNAGQGAFHAAPGDMRRG